jgi:hypothetical protein
MSKRFKSSQDANSALEKSIGSTTDTVDINDGEKTLSIKFAGMGQL